MPVQLDPGDRKVLIAAGIFLVLLVVAAVLLSPPPAEEEEAIFPSTYSASSGGAKAGYLLLKELGYDVERWEQPATELPSEPEGFVLVLAQPIIPASPADQAAVRRFLTNGGHVLATGWSAGWLLPSPDDSPATADCGFEWKPYSARVPSPLAAEAPKITMGARLCWQDSARGPLGVYGDERDPKKVVVITYPVGRGRVIWWAASTPLTNAGLRREGNLALLLNSIGSPETTSVLWDEYYHGQHGSLITYFRRTPMLWGLAQLGLVFAAVCLAYARRSGPVRPAAVESRLSPLEYVETVGDLYHRARAAASAVELAYQRFRFQLIQHLGLPARATPEEMSEAAARRLGRREPKLLPTLQRCERLRRGAELREEEALLLIQALHEYARQLQLTPRAPGDTR